MPPGPHPRTMAPIVLVHGSFHGGWCWRKVAPALRAAGHEVYTPTLTGLGERSHLVHPNAGLHLNVEDVAKVFAFEDIHDAVLVGHSYGGLVVTGAAEHVADRLSRLVYLDGYLPEHGQTAWDITPGGEETWERRAREAGSGWLVPPPDPAEQYGVTDPGDLEWLRSNLTPTTLATHEEPLEAPEERSKTVPRTFVSCTEYETFQPMAAKAEDEGLDYHEIETGHDAMVTAPEALTDVLLGAAE